jgi:hypothetical protein
MTRLAHVLSTLLRIVRTRRWPREYETDRPASFAEVVAASAFLDFGGMPSGDWLHAWEASSERDCHVKNEEPRSDMPLPRQTIENKSIGGALNTEKNIFDPGRAKHAACDLTRGPGFPFRARDAAPMLLVDKVSGVSAMRPVNGSPTLHFAMCVAAFGFVVGLLVFAHPALPLTHTNTAISSSVAMGFSRLSGP